MSDETFVPITKESKELFKRYLSLKEKFLIFVRKVKDAHQACNNAETYRLQLCNRGIDENSEVFKSIKIDQGLIKAYLEIMDRYLARISADLERLYRAFYLSNLYSFKPFYDRENTITRLFDIVSVAETKCMQRRDAFVRRCLEALESTNTTDYLSMLL